jgi:hypothetical protein
MAAFVVVSMKEEIVIHRKSVKYIPDNEITEYVDKIAIARIRNIDVKLVFANSPAEALTK